MQNDIEQRPDSLTSGSDHRGQGLLTDFGATVSGMRSLAKGASNRSLFLALCDCGSSFRSNINLHRRAWLEAYFVTIFVLQRVLDGGSLDTDHRRLLLQSVLFPVRSDVET